VQNTHPRLLSPVYARALRLIGTRRLQFADAYCPLEASSKARGVGISLTRRCGGVAGAACVNCQYGEGIGDVANTEFERSARRMVRGSLLESSIQHEGESTTSYRTSQTCRRTPPRPDQRSGAVVGGTGTPAPRGGLMWRAACPAQTKKNGGADGVFWTSIAGPRNPSLRHATRVDCVEPSRRGEALHAANMQAGACSSRSRVSSGTR